MFTIRQGTMLYNQTQYNVVQSDTVQCNNQTRYNVVQSDAVQYCTVRHSTVLYNRTQYNVAQSRTENYNRVVIENYAPGCDLLLMSNFYSGTSNVTDVLKACACLNTV